MAERKKKQVTEFTVDRSRWLTGKVLKGCPEGSGLYKKIVGYPKPMMCCLGFLAREAGETAKAIGPFGLICEDTHHEAVARVSRKLLVAQESIACTNDDEKISNALREQRIRGKFAKLGVKVNFVGKYPKAAT